MYNGLVKAEEGVKEAKAQIETVYQRRLDLIPNLIETVKGYAEHERTLLSDITKARADRGWDKISDNEKVDMDNAFTKAVGGVMLAVENYPDLKANENFMHLQRTLNELEEQISAARRAYNASVTDYNNAVEMFPSNIIASMANFQRKNFFEIPDNERQNINAGNMLKS